MLDMKESYYENQGTNTFLVYELEEQDALDSMSLGMLTNNRIQGIAQTLFSQTDNRKFIKFNVSAKVSLSQFFIGSVNKKRLLGVFRGIVNAMLATEDYMLDPASIILDTNYIFVDVSTCETALICLPVENGDHKPPELGMFFKNIMLNTQFDQIENCDHVAKILNFINSTPVFSLENFKMLLGEIGDTNGAAKVNQPAAAAVPAPQPSSPRSVAPQPAVPQPVAAHIAAKPALQHQAAKHENLQFGMNYSPVGQTPLAKVEKVQNTPEPLSAGEKPMTMFYLLQHYNKENAAIYKAQKEAKKGGATTQAPSPAQQKTAPKQANSGFAVPKKQTSANFGFAVPGQQSAPAAVQLVPQAAQQSKPAVQKSAPVYQQTAKPAAMYQQPGQPTVQSANFGETTVLGGATSGETTVLSGAPAAGARALVPMLIRTKNNEKIAINKEYFRIGKERSFVDYCVGDNTAVSRSHANIISRSGEYFVVDTNSTNHTYVNDALIQSNVEVKLNSGDRVTLGNEEFVFRLA